MVSHGCYSSLATFCIYFAVPIFAKLQRFDHQPKDDGSLSLLVVGDWGRHGLYNQTLVATQMGKIGEKLDIGFVISTGDNFYEDGLKGINDSSFLESFSNIYTAKSLQKKWYSVLGNHDYRGDVLAQISPILRKIDSRWVCLRSYILRSGVAEFFFIDTTPFVDKYFNETEHIYDWRGVASQQRYIANLQMDLEEALLESTAIWKIVVGHHTIRSVGHHGDTPELVEKLVPLLEANNVDIYINGHDHCLEHISSKDSSLEYLTSGAGSKAWRGDLKESNSEDVKFFYDGQGFMSLQIIQKDAEFVFYNAFGKILHQWKLSKPFPSSVSTSNIYNLAGENISTKIFCT